MYITCKLRQISKLFGYSTIIWIVFSTFLSKLPLFHSEPPRQLTHQTIQLLIAHPDDEVMFFTPTITELLKPKYNNSISVICFSTGNDQGLGHIRKLELIRSLEILGITHYEIIDDDIKFKDSIKLKWNAADIAEYVYDNTTAILTFDSGGISNHPNHISLYHGALLTDKPIISLKTWPIYIKYSSTLFTNLEISYEYLCKWIDLLSFLPKSSSNVFIFADFPSTILGFAAMSNAHQSQMVWFRYLWFLVSRYTHTNELQFHGF